MIMTVLRQQPRAAGLVLGLIAANFLAWCWALQAFGDSGALMAASLLAWGYGLRHAVDAKERLMKHKISAAPVVDENGQLVGAINLLSGMEARGAGERRNRQRRRGDELAVWQDLPSDKPQLADVPGRFPVWPRF